MSGDISDKCQEDIPLDRCCHQFLPKPERHFDHPGVGNCEDCEYDPENNRKCTGYSTNSTY